jgi:hypothetical protein
MITAKNTHETATTAWSVFDKTTSRWGRLTMIGALIMMVAGPGFLAAELGVDPVAVIGGVLAIAAVFGVVWFVEPLAYFPILGPASMYQAFLIGNNSNKLIPAAIVAQTTIGAKPETRRGQLASVLAICGAATTHLLSLLIVVGLFGSLLIQVIPPDVSTVVQTYVVPAIMGAVIVQMVAGNPQPRILIIAAIVGVVVVFVLVPMFPIVSFFAIAISVFATILLALYLPGRRATAAIDPKLEDVSL